MSDKIIDSLNPKQKEAVVYCDGHELVLAGAGSGKTRVLTSKIAYLMNKKPETDDFTDFNSMARLYGDERFKK